MEPEDKHSGHWIRSCHGLHSQDRQSPCCGIPPVEYPWNDSSITCCVGASSCPLTHGSHGLRLVCHDSDLVQGLKSPHTSPTLQLSQLAQHCKPTPCPPTTCGLSQNLMLAFEVHTTYSGILYCILDPGEVPNILEVSQTLWGSGLSWLAIMISCTAVSSYRHFRRCRCADL